MREIGRELNVSGYIGWLDFHGGGDGPEKGKVLLKNGPGGKAAGKGADMEAGRGLNRVGHEKGRMGGGGTTT